MTTAIVLAGGLGTRLRSVVADMPKPMAPVAGRPFLERLLDYWIAQGVSRFILSVGYKREIISAHFGARHRGVPLAYSVEEEPLGTGGGLLLAMQQLADEKEFLLLNGDTYFAVALPDLKRHAEERRADWCFALFETTDTERYMGMTLGESGAVLDLGRKADGEQSVLANGGVYWVARASVAALGFAAGQKCSLESDLLPRALASGQRLTGLPCAGTFIDIGVPHDYQRAQGLLGDAGLLQPSPYPEKLS